jgi:hypothetical protein
VRQFKNRSFASENLRRISLIHNNLLSIFVIGTANGLANSLIVKGWVTFYVACNHPIIPTPALLETFTLA